MPHSLQFRSQRGFTLIELMIASAILLIAVSGILLALPNAEEGVAAGGMSAKAALAAEERLNSLEVIPPDELRRQARLEPYHDTPLGFVERRWWVLSQELLPDLEGDKLAEELGSYGLVPAEFDLPPGFLRLKVEVSWMPPRGITERLSVTQLITPSR